MAPKRPAESRMVKIPYKRTREVTGSSHSDVGTIRAKLQLSIQQSADRGVEPVDVPLTIETFTGNTLFGIRDITVQQGKGKLNHFSASHTQPSHVYHTGIVLTGPQPFNVLRSEILSGVHKGSFSLIIEPVAETKDVFKFTSLPGEVRNMIYKLALNPNGGKIAIDTMAATGRIKPIEWVVEAGCQVQLLRVSKQIFGETFPILYGSNTFTFWNMIVASNFIWRTMGYERRFGGKWKWQVVHNIELPIRHIAVNSPWEMRRGLHLGYMLSAAPQLESFTVVFFTAPTDHDLMLWISCFASLKGMGKSKVEDFVDLLYADPSEKSVSHCDTAWIRAKVRELFATEECQEMVELNSTWPYTSGTPQ